MSEKRHLGRRYRRNLLGFRGGFGLILWGVVPFGMPPVFDILAGGGGAVLADPIEVGSVCTGNFRDSLAAVFALCKDKIAVFESEEAVHGNKIELRAVYLLVGSAGLVLCFEDRYRGTHIGKRVVCVLEIMSVVAAIDIAQFARGACRLDDVGIIEDMFVEIKRQSLALEVVVENTGIETVAVVGKDVTAGGERHQLRIDALQAHALLFQLGLRDMVDCLSRRVYTVGTRGENIPVECLCLFESAGIEFYQRELDDRVVLDVQPRGLGIKAYDVVGHIG